MALFNPVIECACPICVSERENERLRQIRMRAEQKYAEIAEWKAKTALTFERALGFLRDGKPVRRAGWHKDSHIFATKGNIFVVLPPIFVGKNANPSTWKPYPNDILSDDWCLA